MKIFRVAERGGKGSGVQPDYLRDPAPAGGGVGGRVVYLLELDIYPFIRVL